MTEVLAKAQQWLESNIDEESKAEIRALQGNEDALADAFYKNLEFGTGGLRGVMGIGSNRMNKYTIGMATQGLANYLKKVYPDEQIKVAIAHDSRNNSRFFAETTANVFSANGEYSSFHRNRTLNFAFFSSCDKAPISRVLAMRKTNTRNERRDDEEIFAMVQELVNVIDDDDCDGCQQSKK